MRSFISPQLAFVFASMVFWACSDARAASIYCIGNSLTVDCRFDLLDGAVGCNIDSGATLKYCYDTTTADYSFPDSGPWREAFAANQYDFVTVQPSPVTTLNEDATAIVAWMALQPDATFILHTGWAGWSWFETEYHGGNPNNYCVRSPEYMADLTAEVARRTDGRTMVSTRANDAIDMIYHDIENHVGPFTAIDDIYRDAVHLNTTGRFLAHNLMRQALGQPLSDGGSDFASVPAATKAYLFDKVHAVLELGDANADGVVDDKDASILGKNWLVGSGATWGMGDFNGDYRVNDADAAIMAAHWTASGSEGSVPEPGTVVLLISAAMALWFRRRR
jgi:hypothetical protein